MKKLLPQVEVNAQASHLKRKSMSEPKDWSKSKKNKAQVTFNNVSFSWACGEKAVNECSFSIPKPGLWMLVGSNGSGKSTLFRLLSGLFKPQAGQINCELKTALVFQNPDHQLLLPSCSSDLMLNIPKHLNQIERKQRVLNALKMVGMMGMESRPIHTLSGGQKQRLAIAGALVSEAELLLLDEPTALLDPSSQNDILETVKRLCHRSQAPLTAFWITHRLEELEHCDGAVRMELGKIGAWKSGKEIKELIEPLAVRRGLRVGS